MAQRLLLIAYAATAGTRDSVFSGWSDLIQARGTTPLNPRERQVVVGDLPVIEERVERWVCGPEPAGAATAAGLGGADVEVVAELRDCDFGWWSGLTLDDVGTLDPEALALWLADPRARPHGGESLADLVVRVGRVADGSAWPEGRSVAVVPPLVARALAVHALSAPPEVIFRVDVAPLGRVLISRTTGGWRLQGLNRP